MGHCKCSHTTTYTYINKGKIDDVNTNLNLAWSALTDVDLLFLMCFFKKQFEILAFKHCYISKDLMRKPENTLTSRADQTDGKI